MIEDNPLLGCWNAFVEAGWDKDERRARFNQCPDSLKAGVMSHLKTVAALRDSAKNTSVRNALEAAR